MTFIINKAPVHTDPIETTGVTFGYDRNPVFDGFTTTITPRALTVLVGSNGSGKSTLLGLLAGVLHPHRGTVRVGARDIALAVQRSQVTDTFPITAAEAVMMGRWRRLGLLRRPRAGDRAVVDHWLGELGLDDVRHRTLGELSGGQRQRVLLAQTFAQEASVLLLDEPTTGLDATTADLVISHLRRMTADGATVVAATHDQAVVSAADHRIDLDEVPSAIHSPHADGDGRSQRRPG
ncbi:ATP-binding cassette domain-containing protein [Mycolicibacterium sp. S2-37]|uniref:zinc ABC transporter ATP-binding protein AztA n=1 Tax=Mycolicibacterium sp. S2-37 TaxID=2810297 RepID=UPI001A93DC08|nr:zinc ABC transporter ATP-binding protein AztA [Mycolicibacterium sp. S2-37]MBO0680816.1 ATP-binding cassette domain-containing protein [Mycolicibacterium sp. S2-37]